MTGEEQAGREPVARQGLQLGGFIPGDNRPDTVELSGGSAPAGEQGQGNGLVCRSSVQGAFARATHGLGQRGASSRGVRPDFESTQGGE